MKKNHASRDTRYASRKKKFAAKAPASVANLGPGFDLLGGALSRPWDTVEARWNSGKTIVIDSITGDGGVLPRDPKKNVAGIVAEAMRRKRGIRRGITLSIRKGIPISAGLGGSAASSVAAALAVNGLLGKPYSREKLLPFAIRGEAFVAGDIHWDNILPSLFGGLILVTSKKPLRFLCLKVPKSLKIAVVTPPFPVETRRARRSIPKTIPLEVALEQAGALASLLLSLRDNTFRKGENACPDRIAEPKRRSLIPGFLQIQTQALKAGAFGANIAGSGPSIFALCRPSDAKRVIRTMAKVWEKRGMKVKKFLASFL